MSQPCPQCGNPTAALKKIDTSLKVALEATGQGIDSSQGVCPSCYDLLGAKVSQGVKIRMEEEAKHKNKIKLWKNRINYIKQGRTYMSQKALPEAAMSFEKYIKVLEVIYDVKPGQLTPETFSKSQRSKEMTVITSVYWELIKIYDSSPQYRDRLMKSVDKLLLFSKYSSIFPSVIKKAEVFLRSCKNKEEIKKLIKSSRSGRSCFIATTVYGSENHPKVELFRKFRDEILSKQKAGQWVIKYYYFYAPYISKTIRQKPKVIYFVKLFLNLFSLFIERVLK